MGKMGLSKMKRDIVVAIIIGFFLGAGVASILLNLHFLLTAIGDKNNTNTSQNNTQTTITPVVASAVNLEVIEPADDSIAIGKNIVVKGKTQPENYVVLENNLFQDVVIASNDGSFAIPLTLSLGTNDMNISSYNKNMDSITKTITVLYQDEKL